MALTLRPRPVASPRDVSDFATRTGFHLPDDYRTFLLTVNGGRCLAGGVFRNLQTNEKVSRVGTVLGLSGPDYENLEINLGDLAGRIPDALLPVAYDGGGNWLLLDCSRDQASNGKVYFLDLEAANGDVPRKEDLTVVARSFSNLLDGLDED
jgi:SMI1 / KNR4 family (SUKH-1)